ncbi:hypothetical protein [Fusobacterium nucleatum]|jgi:hypothetical protein|nr:hypothetical protein [Fusobacterium nucleatum]
MSIFKDFHLKNKDFLKFFVNKTKIIIADKKKINIRQLELFENYRENRI